MTDNRPGKIWGLVAAQAVGRGGRVSAGDVCAATVIAVAVTGAWLSATGAGEAGHLMRVTDEVSEQLAELSADHEREAIAGCVRLRRLGTGFGSGRVGRRRPMAGLRPGGRPGRGCGDLRVPVADRGDPGRRAEPVPRPARPAERLPARGCADPRRYRDSAATRVPRIMRRMARWPGPGGRPADLAPRRAEFDQATGLLTSSSASASPRLSSGCAPTLMLRTGG